MYQLFCARKSRRIIKIRRLMLVENSGIEPLTSCMPCRRSPEVSGVHHHKTQPHICGYIYSAVESLFESQHFTTPPQGAIPYHR